MKTQNKLKLTTKQKEILVGIILGDGHLETQNSGITYRLKVEHSIKQKEYVDYLYQIFKEFTISPLKERTRISLGKELKSYGFTTISSGIFRFYGQQFYHNGKKVMPKIISKMFSPKSLAMWFMDDGSYKSVHHRTYIIHANCYTKDELELIKSVFEKKFGIKVGIHKQYSQWRLYVYSESAQLFKKIIEPYILPSLRYKLG